MTKQNIKQDKHQKPLLIVGIAALVLLVTVAALLITNLVIKKPGDISDVDGGTIVSEKYGTFEIPKENMWVSPFMGSPLFFSNGTDFTYFFDDYMTKLAEYRKKDVKTFKAENKMMIALYSDNLTEKILKKQGLSNEDEYNTLINSEAYPFSNSTSYYCPNHGNFLYFDLHNNRLTFDEHKYAAAQSNVKGLTVMEDFFVCVPKTLLNGWEIPNEQELTSDEKGYCSESVKCLSKKVEVTIDGETSTVYIPVVIISDKGYPLTETIYNEIMAEKAK